LPGRPGKGASPPLSESDQAALILEFLCWKQQHAIVFGAVDAEAASASHCAAKAVKARMVSASASNGPWPCSGTTSTVMSGELRELASHVALEKFGSLLATPGMLQLADIAGDPHHPLNFGDRADIVEDDPREQLRLFRRKRHRDQPTARGADDVGRP
jgi:hypothetical protein